MTFAGWFTQFLPEWILLVGACLVLFGGVTRIADTRSGLSLLSFVVIFVALASTVLLPAPDGSQAAIGLWATSLTHYVRCIALGVGLLIVLVNWSQAQAKERGEYHSMILFSLLGVLLTASANDWVVLFLAIELVSIPTYVLIALSRDDSRAAESSVKYFFLGALAAAVLAYGLSFFYGASGTTTMFRVSQGQAVSALTGAVLADYAVIGLFLVVGGLAFKVAAVPFHVYAPDVYEGAASPVTGLLGFVPKLAGFVALLKVVSAFHWTLPESAMWLLWVMAAVTMTVGNVLALLQKNVKRMLAYSSIAHTGYMLIALLVGPAGGSGPLGDGVAALLFYVAVYGTMNLGAFALLSAFQKEGRPIETLDDLAGLSARAPLACLAFAVCVFSLMGFPPTAGFLGKVYVFSSAFSVGKGHGFGEPLFALAIVGVVNSAVAAAYYLRIVAAAYTGRAVPGETQTSEAAPIRWGLVLCALPLLALFVRPSELARPSAEATAVFRQLLPAASGKLTVKIEEAAGPVHPSNAGS